uniref:Ubiquitin-like protease family profile domain-containing protein n=1 Tax=Brassica oleracea var. oleracea TaxID=109376 RepID=A0A0D3BST3_BRAOL
MQEFYAVTGLRREADKDTDFEAWRNDKGFWGTLLKQNGEVDMKTIRLKHFKECKDWSRVDRVRLVYLCVICFLMAKDEKINIPHAYIRLVMDFDKLRKYPWGLYAYDLLLDSIKKARFKLKKNSYVLDGFSYALQIWLMEAIPDIETLLGQKYKEGISSVRCQYGNGKVSYHDITALETTLGKKAVVFPFISDTGNNDVVASQVEEDMRTQDQLHEKVDVAVEASQDQIDGKDEVAVEGELEVSEKEEQVEPVAKRRVTRKAKDPGCESRKRQLLCQRAAEQNTSLDDQTKIFITGLFNTSFNSMKEEVKKHMDHRYDKLDSEIAQLKQTVAAAIVSRNDVPASERPQPLAMPNPRPKRKDAKLDDVKMSDFHGNLHNVSVSQSSNIDLEMGTQEYLWKTMGNLTQDSYVKGFDPSQKAKVDDPMEWELQIGPSMFTKEMSARIVGPTELLENYVIRFFQEIDATLFLFRKRTTSGRWKANKVAFMSCVFSNQMKCSYATFQKDKTKFKVELLHDYGTGQLPPHGRTGLVWDMDVSRMYVPVFVHGNHWISMCVNFVTRTIEVFDCAGLKHHKDLEPFANLIPRIVKAV